jgi:hypothetical protein
MPERKYHVALDKLVLGKSYSQVHKYIDMPYLVLGKKHRVMFHDPLTAILIGYMVGGNEGAISALLHIWLDRVVR